MSGKDRRLSRFGSALTICGLLLSGAALQPLPARAEDELAILYSERPPFNVVEPDGSVGGIVGSPVGEALRAARIPFAWEPVPTNRSLFEIQENRRRACGLGWYLTQERAEFARFSDPISEDGPLVAVVGRSFHGDSPSSFAALLREPNLRLLLKSGVLYTSITPAVLEDANSRARWTTAGWADVVQEVADQNFDATLLIEEEAEYYLADGRNRPGDLMMLRFPELPRGGLRRLMCTRMVDEDTIRAFNAALHRR